MEDTLRMKISETPIKDRFDDLLEKIVFIRSGIEDEMENEEPHLKHELKDLDTVCRRLEKLRDYVLEELTKK